MVGEKLGSFRIESVLGVGAMGVVYKATNESTGKAAAVKVVNQEIAQRGKTYERFRRESEILQQFRHSNIVRFLAVGRFQGTSYFAMEFIQGKTLEQRLNENGPMPWKEVAQLGVQIAEALHYAHEHGVVHRDLKPSNLMVTDAGRIKLTDFGIAKDLDKTALTATGRTLGTAAYMSPEQIRGTPEISHKTDLYALGIVLYQMLTGVAPFDGSSAVILMHAHLNAPIPRPSAKVAEIPRALDDLVIQLMAKAPQERPWDAAVVASKMSEVVEKVNRGESVAMVWPTEATVAGEVIGKGAATAKKPKKGKKGKTSASRTEAEDSASTRWRHRLETAGLVLALLAMIGIGVYSFWPPSESYLYEHAKVLMASKERHDWVKAKEQYIELLDRDHPNHPYKNETAAWLDQILLGDAEGRAWVLQSQVNTKFNTPKTPNEVKFVVYYNAALAAEQSRDETSAVNAWKQFAAELDPKQTEDRGWYLLAVKREGEVKKGIDTRHELVMKLLDTIQATLLSGKTEEAERLRQELLKQFGQYKELSQLLGVPQTKESAAATPPATTPAPVTTTPKPELPASETPSAVSNPTTTDPNSSPNFND